MKRRKHNFPFLAHVIPNIKSKELHDKIESETAIVVGKFGKEELCILCEIDGQRQLYIADRKCLDWAPRLKFVSNPHSPGGYKRYKTHVHFMEPIVTNIIDDMIRRNRRERSLD